MPRDDAQQPGSGGITVLVVEDDDDARDTLQALIGLLGHRALGASDAEEALHHARNASLDLALVDIGLAATDGYDVARQLRAHAAGAAVRLVALTGFGDASTRDTAMMAGFDDFLVKPVMPDYLEQLLGAVQSSRST